jgi:phage recombination protein Bet
MAANLREFRGHKGYRCAGGSEERPPNPNETVFVDFATDRRWCPDHRPQGGAAPPAPVHAPNAIATNPAAAIWGFSPEQVSLIKEITAPKANLTDRELFVFLYTARRLGLDPVARQLYAVKYKNRASGNEDLSIQTSIDGYRSIAARTEQLGGIDAPVYGPEVDIDGAKYPEWASVTVYRTGSPRGFTAVVRWKEVRQIRNGKLGDFWEKMPFRMLGKCAEAAALRMAFAADLSGVYTEDEMGQAENLAGPTTPDAPQPLTAAQKAQALDVPARAISPDGSPSDSDPARWEMVKSIQAACNTPNASVNSARKEMIRGWLAAHGLKQIEEVASTSSQVTLDDLDHLETLVSNAGVVA